MDLLLPPQTHLDKLKVAARYISLQRGLRSAAWSSFGWGLFTVLIGVLVRPENWLDYIWLGIGAFLLVEGVLLFRSSSADPKLVLLESLALLILGLWNTVGIFLIVRQGGRPAMGGHSFIIGIAQLASAYATFRSYPMHKRICQHVENLFVQELEQMSTGLWKAKPVESPDIVEFLVGTFSSGNKKWKAKFLPEYVILASNKGRKFEVAGRPDVSIEPGSEKMFSKARKLTLKLGNETFKAEMTPDAFERWQAWLSLSRPASAGAAAP